MKTLFKYLPLAFSLMFIVQATLALVSNQLGIGLMFLIFGLYFMFDFKNSVLKERVDYLEDVLYALTVKILDKEKQGRDQENGG